MAEKNYWVSEYFHVVVTEAGKPSNAMFTDLTKNQLSDRFIRPLNRRSKVIHDAEVVDLANLAKIKIIRTSQPCAEALRDLQDRSNRHIDELNADLRDFGAVIIGAAHGWADEDIVDCGADVTSEFIQSMPEAKWYKKDFWQIAGVFVGIISIILAFLALK